MHRQHISKSLSKETTRRTSRFEFRFERQPNVLKVGKQIAAAIALIFIVIALGLSAYTGS
jgi:hypothetical protein